MQIGERLKEERKRLGLSQARLCELMGISRKTLFSYETGKRSPTAVFLAALYHHQFDVEYILNGYRKSPAIPGIGDIRRAAETAWQMVASTGITISAQQFSQILVTLLKDFADKTGETVASELSRSENEKKKPPKMKCKCSTFPEAQGAERKLVKRNIR